MKSIKKTALIISFMLSVNYFAVNAAADETEDQSIPAVNEKISDEIVSGSGFDAETLDEVVSGVGFFLNTEDHIPYLKTDDYNNFCPKVFTTRAEAAEMLYTLLKDKSTAVTAINFPDVDSEMFYAEAISTVASKGIMLGRDDGLFHPDDYIKRGEFASIVNKLANLPEGFAKFEDIEDGYWAYGDISAVVDAGYMRGYEDGTFRPRKNITRAETAVVMNKLLKREPDREAVYSDDILIMPDVEEELWAFPDIVEATTAHEYSISNGKEVWTSHSADKLNKDYGFALIGDNLFYINDDTKQYIRNRTLGNFIFDNNGRYNIVEKIINPGMTKEQMLYAAYEYIKNNFKYQKGNIYSNGSSGWDVAEAEKIFTKGKGNCYSFAAGFTHLSRKFGYDAVPIAGQTTSASGGLTPHGWTEIVIDGNLYIFDPELAMANGYNLFKKTYSNAAVKYYK